MTRLPNRRFTAQLILSIVAVLAMIGTTGGLAEAGHGGPAVPSNNYGDSWATDGCSWVPDSGLALGGGFYDFNHACKHHDGCYRMHWADKNTCDQWFKNDMYASCDELHRGFWDSTNNYSCKSQADIYYRGVQLFGRPAYLAYSYEIRRA
jgi:hypothetical protein